MKNILANLFVNPDISDILESCEKILDTFQSRLHSKEEKTLKKVTEICSIWLKTGQKQTLHQKP